MGLIPEITGLKESFRISNRSIIATTPRLLLLVPSFRTGESPRCLCCVVERYKCRRSNVVQLLCLFGMQVHPRKLVVRHRSKSSSSDNNSTDTAASLFVRLHPTTAQTLWQDALAGKDNEGDDSSFSGYDDEYYWNVTKEKALSTQVSSGIEFLPLRIQTTSQDVSDEDEIVFCSYNGGDIAQGMFLVIPRLLKFLTERMKNQ